jgi:hypothetical protein
MGVEGRKEAKEQRRKEEEKGRLSCRKLKFTSTVRRNIQNETINDGIPVFESQSILCERIVPLGEIYDGGGLGGTVPADSVIYERSQHSGNLEEVDMQFMDGTRVGFMDLAPGSVVAREGDGGQRKVRVEDT